MNYLNAIERETELFQYIHEKNAVQVSVIGVW